MTTAIARNDAGLGPTERRRSRTYLAWGYQTSPVLKTGWATGPVPLRCQANAQVGWPAEPPWVGGACAWRARVLRQQGVRGETWFPPTPHRNDAAFQDMQHQRMKPMAPYIESIGADGIYEVVEELSPS